MKTYEYIALSKWNDTPTKEEFLEKIENGYWYKFFSNASQLDLVAEQILEENYIDWDLYDENEDIYIAVKENNSDYWELFLVRAIYQLSTTSEHILCSED
ncbi:hypothetical protein [Volucribacter amazonae]|uniref:Uncharacterized protein n=1 Tax=Volucribacter amazonae TaxID=256731 RepID=A0A9X4SLH9_9PAST|nr:hypothetical protein [Volucribacter amazonae]MDG6895063.1 hypothetical protein [Volucribacter amazonae]